MFDQDLAALDAVLGDIKPAKSSAPPNAPKVEQAVLTALCESPDALRTALSIFRTSAVFYQPLHMAMFEAAFELNRTGQAVDVVSITEQMRSAGSLSLVGGEEAVVKSATATGKPASIETHCRKLLEYYTLRQVQAVAQQIIRDVMDRTQSPLELLAKAQTTLGACTDTLTTKDAKGADELFDPAFERIKLAMEAKGLVGVPSGILSLDRLTGGWRGGNLIIIAARPGMGKTSLALNFARNAAVDFDEPGIFFTLEMSDEELEIKMIATETGCTSSQLGKGHLPDGRTLDQLRTDSRKLRTSKLLFDDTASLTVAQLRAKVARRVAEGRCKWVIVDYLQLMTGTSGKGGNREQEISAISRGLKLCAKENNIPVIALSQLSRAVEARADKRPQLSDLRESGAIEQDADVVLFPFRAEYYGITEDDMGNPTAGRAELIVAKHRNGPVDTVTVNCDIATGKFFDDQPDWSQFADVSEKKATDLPPSTFEDSPAPPAPQSFRQLSLDEANSEPPF
ncbi:replicative DNA helicase [Hymenobacter koreensis]|uniref:Replicative DNA helicase n=1 Tax=Hymenobacter koreensis TaxID=1084523 RepID=A0ABP8JK22_9BACT